MKCADDTGSTPINPTGDLGDSELRDLVSEWNDPTSWGGPDDTADPDWAYESARDWADPDVL